MKRRDLERLSAYIDQQLPPGERADLEARLQADPELQAALEELALTVRALRTLPRVKPPRSFVLTPAQVGVAVRPARGPMFPTLRLAAAAAAVVLAVVVAGDLATTWRGAAPAAAPAPSGEVALRSATIEATAAPEEPAGGAAQEATLAAAAADAATEGEGAAQTGAALPPEAATSEATPSATPEELMLMAAGTATPTAALEAQRATPAPGDKVMAATATAAPAATFVIAIPAADQNQTPAARAGERETQLVPQLPTVRLIEAALAVLTVLLGLGAWLARR